MTKKKAETFEATLVRRNRFTGLVGLVGIATTLVALVAVLTHVGAEVLGFGFYGAYAALMALTIHFTWLRPDESRTTLRVDERGLFAGETLLRRAGSLRSAKILLRDEDGPVVELKRRLDPYSLRVAVGSPEEARRLVRALGLDAREGVTRFRVPFRALGWAMGAYALFLALAATIVSLLSIPLVPVAAAAMILGAVCAALSHQTVTIGHDGILVGRRFIRHADIAFVERADAELRTMFGAKVSPGFNLHLRSGERVFLRTLQERQGEGMTDGDHLYEAARAAHLAATHDATPILAVLPRGERSVETWLKELRGAHGGGYRDLAMSDDQLFEILEDATAGDAVRAAAAVCLAARKDEEVTQKLRVAADDVAAPKLRVALDAALEEDDDALAQALEELP